MANIFDFNQVGKNTIDKNKKYERQAGEYLAQYNQQLKEEAEQEALNKENTALSSARFAYASTYARSRNRINSLQESITYENTASITGMTEMVSEVVEKALLLDEEEFAQLNPEYKEEIRDRVRGFLENAEINKNIKNRDTLALMEYVYKNLPDVKTGKYLTEDDISRLMKMQKPVEIEESIKNLSGDVSSRVAELVESEQKRIKDTNKKLEDAKVETKEEVAQAPVEEVPEEEEMAAEGEVPVEGEEEMEGAAPTGRNIHIASDGTTSIAMNNGQIAMNADGSMDIQLMEGFVRETPRTGLLETLAVNEAMNLLSEGKEYNSDLCLANALMYITITEAMDTLGLMNVDSNVYSNIISAAGGNVISEASSSAKKAFKNGGADYIKYEAGRELGKKIAKERAEKPYETKHTVEKKMERMAKAGVKDSDDLRKTTALQESCITQWKQPVNNTGYSDLAERIRQRRLAKLTETEKTDSSNPTLLD